MAKWPLTIGDRDRKNQYKNYVEPLKPEEKIMITQQAHMRTQKQLDKALKHIKKALIEYMECHYTSDKAIELLAKEQKNLTQLKEKIKQITYNSLPYKEIENTQEEKTTQQLSRWQKTTVTLIGINILLYIIGWTVEKQILGIGMLYSVMLGWLLYYKWATKQKTKPSHKIKPNFW